MNDIFQVKRVSLYKHPNGKLIYMEINPENGYLNFTTQPVDVFKNPEISAPLWLGCWGGKMYVCKNSDGIGQYFKGFACPTLSETSSDSAPQENRFFLFYRNEPNYPKDESNG